MEQAVSLDVFTEEESFAFCAGVEVVALAVVAAAPWPYTMPAGAEVADMLFPQLGLAAEELDTKLDFDVLDGG